MFSLAPQWAVSLVAAASLTTTGGLAATGNLPGPAQDAVAGAAGHVGLNFPHSDGHPSEKGGETAQDAVASQGGPEVAQENGNNEHGQAVSELARNATSEGCAKGQEIAALASGKAADHRQDGEHRPEGVNPCEQGKGGPEPTDTGNGLGEVQGEGEGKPDGAGEQGRTIAEEKRPGFAGGEE